MAAVVTGTVVVAFCIPLTLFITSVANDRAIDGAELEARSLAAELTAVSDHATIERLARQENVVASTSATVYLVNGQMLGARPGAPTVVPASVRAGHAVTIATPAGEEVWVAVRAKSDAVAVAVSVPRGLLTRGVTRELVYLYAGGVLLVLIAIVLADWMGRTIVRPISELEDVTRLLSAGDMLRRVDPAGPYEVAEVGRAVNELADRIDSFLESARMAGADLGHRLRTPLTALRLDIEALADRSTKDALVKDLKALERAVNRLIRETREPPLPRGHADLAAAIAGRATFWTVLARSQDRRFSVKVPSRDIEVALDKDDLEAAIDELVSNVFAHTPEGTSFRVELRETSPGSTSWTLLVEDDGPSSTEPRTPTSRYVAGTSLGLDIVRRTAERAGGAMHLGRSQSGGFRVELTIPETIPIAPEVEKPSRQRT